MADADSGDPNEISILTKPFHRRGSVLLRGPLHSCNCIVGYATSVWQCQSLVEEGWLPERANNIWAEKNYIIIAIGSNPKGSWIASPVDTSKHLKQHTTNIYIYIYIYIYTASQWNAI